MRDKYKERDKDRGRERPLVRGQEKGRIYISAGQRMTLA